MKIFYFGGIDSGRDNRSFTMIVSAESYSEAKQECLTWLRTRQRDDIADLIEKSEQRAVRVVFPNTPCVLHSDVIWSIAPPEKVLAWLADKLQVIYVYGDDEIHVDSPTQVRTWPDSHEIAEATKEITWWEPRNNFQYFEATKPEAVIEWLKTNAKLKEL